MRVITRNSVYTVNLLSGGLFHVRRTASTWGQRVVDAHEHFSREITLGVGSPFVTSHLRTTDVLAISEE
jgi:hypothetical protein